MLFRVNETQLIKQWKRTTKTTFKNPNWLEAKQLPLYKCNWEVEPGPPRNKLSEWSERVLYLGPPHLNPPWIIFLFLFDFLFTLDLLLLPGCLCVPLFICLGGGLIAVGSFSVGVDSIPETFMCLSPCFDSVFSVFYTFLRINLGCLSLCFKVWMRCSAWSVSAGSWVWFVLCWWIFLASLLFFPTPKKIELIALSCSLWFVVIIIIYLMFQLFFKISIYKGFNVLTLRVLSDSFNVCLEVLLSCDVWSRFVFERHWASSFVCMAF